MRFFENIYIKHHTSFSSRSAGQERYRENQDLLELTEHFSDKRTNKLPGKLSDKLPGKLPSVRNFYVRKNLKSETCFLIVPESDDSLSLIAVVTDAPVRMIAAYKDSVFAGYALYEVHPDHLYLDKCFVREEFRSLGIAGKLLRGLKLTEQALIRDGIPLFVYAYPYDRGNRLSQEALNRFYLKHGFQLIPHVIFWK